MTRALVLACLAMLPKQHASAANCLDKTSQAEMNMCSYGKYKQADVSLNATYRPLLARPLQTDMRGKLVVAQRAWVAFRDAECAFEASGVEGGSVQPTVLSSCLDDATQRRDKDLTIFLRCVEGDLSCPVPAK